MAEEIIEPAEKRRRKKGLLATIALTTALGGLGFASSYLGYWSALDLFSAADAKPAPTGPSPEFVQVPRVELTISMSPLRTLFLTAMIETDVTHRTEVEHLVPRVSDALNTFLSEVDPSAFDKRGVLEIVRAELVTRARFVIGEEPVRDVLITEFRLQ